MKQLLDKTRNRFRMNRSMFLFLLVLIIIGVVAGSVFILMISKEDQGMVKEYLDTFLFNIRDHKLHYLQAFQGSFLGNLLFVLGIWLLGISAIGLPVMVFMFFTKAFTLGFAISSMIMNYKLKGCLLAFIYVFPHHVMNLLLYSFLMAYALSFSIRLIGSLVQKKSLDFKVMMNKYLMVLGICVGGVFISSLMEVFLVPFLLQKVLGVVL